MLDTDEQLGVGRQTAPAIERAGFCFGLICGSWLEAGKVNDCRVAAAVNQHQHVLSWRLNGLQAY